MSPLSAPECFVALRASHDTGRRKKGDGGMSVDPVSFKNTKHILRAANFLRDLVLKGAVVLRHVKGTRNLADLLTKAVARAVFIELLRLLDSCPDALS